MNFKQGLLILLLITTSVYGQPLQSLKFDHLSTEEGLSQASVTCFLKDRFGFLWVGTRDGLNRYDSYDFTQFKTRTGDSTTISNNTISCLFEDESGIIWIGTEGGGVNLYNPETEVFSLFETNLPGKDTGEIVGDITGDSHGNIWIASRSHGLLRYNRSADSVEVITSKIHTDTGNPLSSIVTSVIEDSKGLIWFTTEGSGLIRYDPHNELYKIYSSDPDVDGTISTDFVSKVMEDSMGRLWVLSWGYGLNLMDPTEETFSHYTAAGDPGDIPNNNIFSISEDDDGIIWLGTRDGLSQFDMVTGKIRNSTNIPGNLHSLADNVIYSLFYDESDRILWVGTWGDGINYLDPLRRNTRHFQHVPEVENSLNSDNVFAFHEDRDGILWIGTEGGGLNRYDPVAGTFKAFKNIPENPGSISSNDILTIHQDRQGIIWIGTYGGGVNRLDPETGVFSTVDFFIEDENALRSVLSIYEDSMGILWLTTNQQGIARLDPMTSQVDFYQENEGFEEGNFNDVLVITGDEDGILWIGTRNSGLVRFDPRQQKFIFYQQDPDDPTSLGANGIYALHDDGNGNLWIGTRGAGLNILQTANYQNPEFTKISSQQGLFNDWVLGIEEDAHGYIWASGEGISKIDKETLEIETFEFTSSNQGAFYKSPATGHFYLGAQGFDVFHPDSISIQEYDTPVLISSLSRYNTAEQVGNAIPVPGIITLDSMVFDYKDQILAFEFVNIDYNSPETRNYLYQLENFNQDWIRIGNERKITFTGLAAGHYTLKVKTELPSGKQSSQMAKFSFTILPPWWNSEWARILYFLIAITGLYSVYYWRTVEQRKSIKQKEKELLRERELNERLQQVDKLKDQFLANTSHELRTPLQGIIGLSESLMERENDAQNARDLSMIISSGKRLSNLINGILDFSKLKSHDLTLALKPVDLWSVTAVVVRINQPLIRGKQIELINDVPIDLPLIVADEDRLQQVLYNLIGNAVKFTETGQIHVFAGVEGDFAEIGVQDSGIGIPEDKQESIFKSFEQIEDADTRHYEGTGLGLAITRKLVELMGGKIHVVSEPGAGSIFKFTLPLSKEINLSVRSAKPSVEATSALEIVDREDHDTGRPDSGLHRILVVDDEVVNQQVLRNYLAGEAYEIDMANNGEEALEKINDGQKYDLVLLDVMMPRISGYDVCREIRKKYLSSELPVIMITARSQTEDLVKGFNTGANDYVTKPLSKGELLSRVKTHLNLARINKSNAKFIPVEFLQSIGKESILDVKLGDQSLRNVTVMFTDIRSYTTLSESMSPDENFKFLNKYLSYISPVIRKNKGFINQFLGDGFMAIFIESTDPALKASVEIQREVDQFNAKSGHELSSPIEVGIGLHTGQLMMGILGDKDRMEAGVVSDTVNTASRMEGLTKYFGAPVIISESTYEGLNDPAPDSYRFLGRIKVKGKTKAFRIYEVLDGNSKEIRQKKTETYEDFEAGLNEYLNKSFATASVFFEKVLNVFPEDRATKLYLKNAAHFMVHGVDETWEGVETLESK